MYSSFFNFLVLQKTKIDKNNNTRDKTKNKLTEFRSAWKITENTKCKFYV